MKAKKEIEYFSLKNHPNSCLRLIRSSSGGYLTLEFVQDCKPYKIKDQINGILPCDVEKFKGFWGLY